MTIQEAAGTELNSNIGKMYEASASVNITSADADTYFSGASVTVPSGTYIVIAMASFASSGTEAARRVSIFDKTDNKRIYTTGYWGRWWVNHQAIRVVKAEKNTQLITQISAGVTLTGCSTFIQAIRII